jgi:ATP-binding cassette subfamily B protein
VRALARLYPFARSVLPRLVLGAVSALVASLLALPSRSCSKCSCRARSPRAPAPRAIALVWGALILVLGLRSRHGVAAALVRPGTVDQGRVRLRTSFYERLQRLPVAFHDRWQSGQLLSRMMQDISMLRRWMAFASSCSSSTC